MFPVPLNREMGSDPGVFGRFDLAALVQPHLHYFCLFVSFLLLGTVMSETALKQLSFKHVCSHVQSKAMSKHERDQKGLYMMLFFLSGSMYQ